MLMDEGLDTGPILMTETVPIAPAETGASLTLRLAELGRRVVPEGLAAYAAGRLAPRPQPRAGVTTAAKLTRAEARLDWRKPAAVLEREVRAFHPVPGSWFLFGQEPIKVLEARIEESRGAPGTVLGPGLTVASGEGALRLLRVQRPGRAAMTDEALLRGYAIPPGTVLPS
jgi:methionyl-tRNA formyltransferase